MFTVNQLMITHLTKTGRKIKLISTATKDHHGIDAAN